MNPRFQGIGMTSQRTRGRMIQRLIDQGIESNVILDVMASVPRHIFVEEALASRSYEDTALPIGFNQTISQPYIVAKMTELLIADFRPKKVLEIGSGCGYQTAILASLVDKVYSVERIQQLHKKAKKNLYDLKLHNAVLKFSDGGWGWPEQAPFDAILVTAAPPEIPQKLLDQMAVGGKMIIPVGRGSRQVLNQVVRNDEGFDIVELEPVSFVPFLSGKS